MGRFISEDPAKDGVNWYAYANNNPLLYVDPSGLAAFAIKREYREQDVYDYIALNRGGEFSHNLIGFIPGAGFVSWAAKNTGGITEITEKNWRDHLLAAGPNVGDLASMAKHFKNIPQGSKISKVGAKASTGLNLVNLGAYTLDTGFIRDQSVSQIGGMHMSSSTKEGVIVKYGYLRERIDELIESEELTYKRGFFGLGNVIDYEFQTEDTKENLIQELIVYDAILVKVGLQTEEQYHRNFPGYFKERELALDIVNEDFAEMYHQEDDDSSINKMK